MISVDLFRNEEDTLPFAAGQTIFSQGDSGEAMYVVIEGKVALTVNGTLVEELEAGGLFGELALIDTAPRIAPRWRAPTANWWRSMKNASGF